MSAHTPLTAFVLGAGLGTRLRPLTARRPKPLIPVGGRPLITHAFDHLLALGVEQFVVNTHWCAGRYGEFFPAGEWRGRPVTFIEETPEVLETAGGIWNARALLGGGPFVVYNGDILSDIPLAEARAAHVAAGNEVTLILRTRGENRNVAYDPASGRVLDLRRTLRPELEPQHLFTGIYFVEPQFIARIPAGEKLSVVPIFHTMIREGAKLGGCVLDGGDWRDLGTREEYLAACATLGQPQWIADSAQIGAGAELHDCLVWENAVVARRHNPRLKTFADRLAAAGKSKMPSSSPSSTNSSKSPFPSSKTNPLTTLFIFPKIRWYLVSMTASRSKPPATSHQPLTPAAPRVRAISPSRGCGRAPR